MDCTVRQIVKTTYFNNYYVELCRPIIPIVQTERQNADKYTLFNRNLELNKISNHNFTALTSVATIPLRNRILKKFIECTVMQTYRYEYDYGDTICRQCHFTCCNN